LLSQPCFRCFARRDIALAEILCLLNVPAGLFFAYFMNHRHNKIYRSICLCSLVIAFSEFSKENGQDCAMYKTGNFYYYNKVSKQRINIERRDSLQVEKNEKGDITVSRVSWKGTCEYELLFNYMTPKEVSKDGVYKVFEPAGTNIPLRIKILSGTDSYYVFEASKEGFKTLQDTVWLLRENASAFTK
jgi:hypothetical protein